MSQEEVSGAFEGEAPYKDGSSQRSKLQNALKQPYKLSTDRKGRLGLDRRTSASGSDSRDSTSNE